MTIVVIPTYNEIDNLVPIVRGVHAAVPGADVLVVDDASPDGTGALADRLAAADPRLHVLHRNAKEGLGAAYRAGFRWALDRGYAVIAQMDADGSHAPEHLPSMLAALAVHDVVLGSRYVPGGELVGWPWHRLALSRVGNAYARSLLRMRVADVTGGYRAFRAPVLECIGVDDLDAGGYCFQIEVAWRCVRSGADVVEVPIRFAERERGTSKMSRAIVVEALLRTTRWGLGRGPELPAPLSGRLR